MTDSGGAFTGTGRVPAFITRTRKRRVMVVSNCQTIGLANSMRALTDFLVDAKTAGEFGKLDQAGVDALGDYDHIFALPSVIESYEDTPLHGKFVPIPHLYFNAFHPDLLTYDVTGPDKRPIGAPIGHSAIVTACFQQGLDVAQTAAMFRAEVFEKLQYLDVWDNQRDLLFERCNASGYTVEEDFYRWCTQGCFMHLSNHPRLLCVMDVAVDALRRVGVRVSPRYEIVMDNLALGPIFPAYTEIAACYGFAGSYRFKPGGTSYTLSLPEFIASTFEGLAAAGPDGLVVARSDRPRVDRARALLQ
jgi:hypothetical protein